MGEAIITRAGGGSEEQIIPIIPGYHTMIVKLLDYNNNPIQNYCINCKDGASWYNYTTNEKGQAMFTTNSGSANFSVYNNINGRYIDFRNTFLNADAPIGQSSKKEIKLIKETSTISITNTSNVKFLLPIENINVKLCGGGGGGGGGSSYWDGDNDYPNLQGGPGGSGYVVTNKMSFNSNTNINCYIGYGGSGGHGQEYWQFIMGANGGSGGTTQLDGKISATGGGGGQGHPGWYWENPSSGVGGAGISPYGIGGSGGSGSRGNGGTGKSGVIQFLFV